MREQTRPRGKDADPEVDPRVEGTQEALIRLLFLLGRRTFICESYWLEERGKDTGGRGTEGGRPPRGAEGVRVELCAGTGVRGGGAGAPWGRAEMFWGSQPGFTLFSTGAACRG